MAGLRTNCSNIKQLSIDFRSSALDNSRDAVIQDRLGPPALVPFWTGIKDAPPTTLWQIAMFRYEEIQWARVMASLQRWIDIDYKVDKEASCARGTPLPALTSLKLSRSGCFKIGSYHWHQGSCQPGIAGGYTPRYQLLCESMKQLYFERDDCIFLCETDVEHRDPGSVLCTQC
jgi:hypothetical protein